PGRRFRSLCRLRRAHAGEFLPQAVAAPVRVALRRADRHAGGGGDLLERHAERVLQRDHGRLRRRQLGEAAAELAAGLGGDRGPGRVAVAGDAPVLVERLCAACRGEARLGDVLARVDDEPVQPRRELRFAAKLADAPHELHERLLGGVVRVLGVAQDVKRDRVHAIRVAGAERLESARVTVLDTSDQNGVGEPLVVEGSVLPGNALDSTAPACLGLHARTLVVVRALTPEVVLPVLRGSFGRHYHWAEETETTQRLLPADAPHGSVALAEHQTAGRGRLGRTWVDSALMLSVCLRPAPPVADWPELTLVAARAVAGAIGPGAAIKHPNDVLVDGRKVAGILAEASERVVLGIGINVNEA